MSFFKRLTLITVFSATAALTPILAQSAPEEESNNGSLNLPEGQLLFQRNDPNIRRPTAQVNGEVITGTDIDQRLALLTIDDDAVIPPEQLPTVRAQILGRLIDETLQIQEAAANEVEITQAEIDRYYASIARENYKRAPADLDKLLISKGASGASLKRRIRGDLSWNRLLSRNIRPQSNVSDDEVTAYIERNKAAKGSTEYRLGEIYLAFRDQDQQQVLETARKIMESLREGGNFAEAARKFSDSSTAPVGGDLGWAKLSQLPTALGQAALEMSPNEIVPVQAPGGVSILLMIDKRQVGSADPRDSVLSLKQVAINFAPGTSKSQFDASVKTFSDEAQKITGCGTADDVAKRIGAEVVNRDGIVARNLPGALQNLMLQLQVGQSTPPYGSVEDGVRVFVLCGRDAPKEAADENFEQILERLENERVEKRATTYLRDLRRDAIIDYKTATDAK